MKIREGPKGRRWEETFLLEVCTRMSVRVLQILAAELADEPCHNHAVLLRLVEQAIEWRQEGARAKGGWDR
jgi:hypothetical protein